MMKVLLINAPYVDLYGPIKFAAGRFFPLGLGYIASFLKQKGFDVSLYEPEAQKMDYDAIGRAFRVEQPDIIGISSATPNFHNAVKIAKLAKDTCDCTVVYGGVHASAIPEFIVDRYRNHFDYVVIGEGEETMAQLMLRLKEGGVPHDIPGLCFWHKDELVRTGPRAMIDNLDILPYPARELIPQQLLRPNMHNIRYRRCFTILTSRGCPFNCSFCASYLTMGKGYRIHSADYVLDEMTLLKKEYGAQQLIINDDTFTLDRARLIDICEGMIRRGLGLDWFCFSQISAVDKDLLKLMRRAGCYNIGFGVESGSPEILREIGKPISQEKAKEVISCANSLGMKTQAFFVLGKERDYQDVKDTIDLALSLKPTLAFFNMLVPYPGTRDFDHFFKDIPLDQIDWKDFVGFGPKAALSQLSGRSISLERALYTANLKFYLRPSQLMHILSSIRTFYELKAYIRGGMGLVLQLRVWGKRN